MIIIIIIIITIIIIIIPTITIIIINIITIAGLPLGSPGLEGDWPKPGSRNHLVEPRAFFLYLANLRGPRREGKRRGNIVQ